MSEERNERERRVVECFTSEREANKFRPAPVQVPEGFNVVHRSGDTAKVWPITGQQAMDIALAVSGVAAPSAPAAPAVDAEKASGWIPVGERLPDMEAGYVLVHCEGGKIGDDFFCRNREFLHHAGNRYSRKHQGKESGYFRCAHEYGYRITHWQPLPPPPAIANQEAQDGR